MSIIALYSPQSVCSWFKVDLVPIINIKRSCEQLLWSLKYAQGTTKFCIMRNGATSKHPSTDLDFHRKQFQWLSLCRFIKIRQFCVHHMTTCAQGIKPCPRNSSIPAFGATCEDSYLWINTSEYDHPWSSKASDLDMED